MTIKIQFHCSVMIMLCYYCLEHGVAKESLFLLLENLNQNSSNQIVEPYSDTRLVVSII